MLKLLLILSKIFLLTAQMYGNNNYEMIFFYISKISQYKISVYFPKKESKQNFHYRGRPENIEKIIANNKYNSYKSVYIKEKVNEIEIKRFPKSTIFFINQNYFNVDIIKNNSDYYFIPFNFYDSNSKYYIIINHEIYTHFSDYINIFLLLFSVLIFCFFNIYIIFNHGNKFKRLYINCMAHKKLISSLILALLCISI